MEPLQFDISLNNVQIEDRIIFDAKMHCYQCLECNATYTNKKTAKAHLKYDCGKLPRFKCPYCNKRNKSSSNIYKHVRSMHSGFPVNVIKKH